MWDLPGREPIWHCSRATSRCSMRDCHDLDSTQWKGTASRKAEIWWRSTRRDPSRYKINSSSPQWICQAVQRIRTENLPRERSSLKSQEGPNLQRVMDSATPKERYYSQWTWTSWDNKIWRSCMSTVLMVGLLISRQILLPTKLRSQSCRSSPRWGMWEDPEMRSSTIWYRLATRPLDKSNSMRQHLRFWHLLWTDA